MQISDLAIDREVVDNPQVAAIKSRLHHIPSRIIDERAHFFESISKSDDPIRTGKQTLFLTKNRGAFIRVCPGTHSYTCCGYKILHIGTFCTMDCSYCILQSYFHPPVLQYFVNHTDLLMELERYFDNGEISRIGTGEFTDSLIWEKWTDLSKILVQKFAGQQKCVLELKSKTVSIGALQHLDHQKKTIVSWSLNTQPIIKTEEHRTAPLSARLKAAQKCESWGYPIGFHFDPIIIYDNWEQDYEKVIQQIFKYVSPLNIVWISLGTFRYMPALKPIIQKRFPDSKIVYGEFIPGLDSKMRYFKPLRVRIYEKIVAWIRQVAPEVTIYFCMESDDVWQRIMGYVPDDRGGLESILDESAVKHCKLES